MAQVTYRGVKYDTNDKQQAKSSELNLTYRGTKFTKKVASVA